MCYNPRQLGRKRKKKIGVLVELTREFGRGICKGITAFASEVGDTDPVFISPKNLSRRKYLKSFDGFIARVMTEEIAAALAATGKPVIDVYYDKPRDGFAIVKTNHARVGRIAAQHFIERKFQHFGFCGFSGGRFSTYCLIAYRRALRLAGHTCETYLPRNDVRYEFDAASLIAEILSPAPDAAALLKWIAAVPKPIAVFCPNDLRAWQLLQVCKDAGLDVPRDVAILGLDNDAIVCGFCQPMISSIDPDTPAIGRESARTLAEIISHPRMMKRPIIRQVNPIGVAERASTETYPLKPEWLSDALVFIHRHVADGISAEDVFRHLGLSHTIVSREFRRTLDTTVQKEIAKSRLDEARHLLKATSLSVNEIAVRAGFASNTYFLHSFSAAHGISPLEYRRRNS